MSTLRQRMRIARVRRVQHDLAALAAAEAVNQVRSLEVSHRRIGEMRDVLIATPGQTLGAQLASQGELAMRLEAARDNLDRSIASARSASELRERARLGARRDLESAGKLERKAAEAAAAEEERRMLAAYRGRRPRFIQGDIQ